MGPHPTAGYIPGAERFTLKPVHLQYRGYDTIHSVISLDLYLWFMIHYIRVLPRIYLNVQHILKDTNGQRSFFTIHKRIVSWPLYCNVYHTVRQSFVIIRPLVTTGHAYNLVSPYTPTLSMVPHTDNRHPAQWDHTRVV